MHKATFDIDTNEFKWQCEKIYMYILLWTILNYEFFYDAWGHLN